MLGCHQRACTLGLNDGSPWGAETSTMQFSSLPAELQAWLKQSIQMRCSREAIEQSLSASGYQRDYARRAAAAAFDALTPPHGDAGTVPVAASESPPSSSQILLGGPNLIDAGDRQVQILMVLNSPRIILFGDLLSREECDALIEMSRGKLARSNVVNRDTGHYDVHPDRTSEGTYFRRGENDLVERIERRIAELTSSPVERGEPIQILRYCPGAQYKPHFDYFDPSQPGNQQVLSTGGQRVATLVMYLNDVQAGGSTIFPEIGLDVLPRRGHAVFFAYADEQGRLDSRTLHGGSPVAAGEKWIATKWIRQHEYSDLRIG